MKDHLSNLAANLAAGIRLARFAKLQPGQFRVSPDQIVLLVILDLGLDNLFDFLDNLPSPEFNVFAVAAYGFQFALLLLAAYAVRKTGPAEDDLLLLPTAVLSLLPVVYGVWYPVFWLIGNAYDADPIFHAAIFGTYIAWMFSAMARIIGLLRPPSPRMHAIAAIAAFAIWVVPSWHIGGQAEFWYAGADEDDDPYAAFRNLDAEATFYAQPPLLEQALSQLLPQRAGLIDVYFLGFAGYARQDVFLKETRYAQNLFDREFDTVGRSLILANHLDTYKSVPLANGHNLAASLKAIGQQMNRDEDVLVMYMTSHGSRHQGLSVDFWPLTLNDIKPDVLKRHLDDAGIKWRVLMISSCYSGTFIEALKNPYTVIATASAADRTSFGCGDHNDFTYFGEAVLKDQLSRRPVFVESLDKAAAEIARREQAEGIEERSNPQTFVGDAIAPRLKILEQRLAKRGVGSRG